MFLITSAWGAPDYFPTFSPGVVYTVLRWKKMQNGRTNNKKKVYMQISESITSIYLRALTASTEDLLSTGAQCNSSNIFPQAYL